MTGCEHLRASLDDFRRGELNDEERFALQSHLDSCAGCRELVDKLDLMRRAVERSEMDPIQERRLLVAIGNRALPERRPLRWGLVLVPAAAAAAVIALVMTGTTTPEPTATQAEPARTATPGEQPVTASVYTSGLAGERQSIAVAHGTNLWLDGEAAVHVESLSSRLARFRLARGRVVAEVGPRIPEARFVVATPHGEVEARGTLFSVEVDSERVRVRVVEGLVEVRSDDDGASHLLGPGEEMALDDEIPVAAAEADLRRDVCLALGCTSADRVGTDRSEPVPATTSAAGTASGLAASTEDAARAIAERRFDEAARLVDEIARKNPGAAAGPELLSKLARAYRRAKLFGPAADAYRRLDAEFPGTNAAINGLVALGQIEQGALGEPASAVAHFDSYLALQPTGFLAEAARAGRVRALGKLGRSGELVGAANEYLSRHPGGASAAEMHRRRGEALARTGRCAEAKEDFEKVISGWHGTAEADRAAAGLAACGD